VRSTELRALATLAFVPRTLARLLLPLAADGAGADFLLERAHEMSGPEEWWPGPQRIDEEIRALERTGAWIVPFGGHQYPELLQHVHDPPLCLHVRGQLPGAGKTCVAIVGSRASKHNCLSFTLRMARELAEAHAPVVSGMARGVDSAAHAGCLDGGERTVAVLGCGVDVCYPRDNRDLMKRILENGAVVSEHPMGTKPVAHHFPARNRIISGWCAGTVIVEAAQGGGGLITARCASEQDRTVFAVPGAVWNPLSWGPNHLIRDGAVPVTCAEDILEELFGISPPGQKPDSPVGDRLSWSEEVLLEFLDYDSALHVDDLARLAGMRTSEALPVLLQLEVMGLVLQLRGLRFLRAGGGGTRG
jgi:DNA processing protein